MKDEEKPVWTAREVQKISSRGARLNRVEGQLLADGAVVHVVNGPNGFRVCQAFAEEMNMRKEPAPGPGVKLRADGWNQPKDSKKVPIQIPASILNWKFE